jgi:D-aminopeptidase
MDQFNTEAMKLGAMGVTVMVSSGDNGVAADESLCDLPSGSDDVGQWKVT